MAKITDMTIRKLSPKDKAYDEPLGNNLYITVRPNGRKVFTLRYTENGKRSKIKLGEYPILSLAQAMAQAEEKNYYQNQ